jgi:hypothetical protein
VQPYNHYYAGFLRLLFLVATLLVFLPARGSGGAEACGCAAGPAGPAGPPGRAVGFGANAVSYVPGRTGQLDCVLGQMILSASRIYAANWAPADGTLLRIRDYPALHRALGDTFGGDGISTFALPDLSAQAPDNTRYFICVEGIRP